MEIIWKVWVWVSGGIKIISPGAFLDALGEDGWEYAQHLALGYSGGGEERGRWWRGVKGEDLRLAYACFRFLGGEIVPGFRILGRFYPGGLQISRGGGGGGDDSGGGGGRRILS